MPVYDTNNINAFMRDIRSDDESVQLKAWTHAADVGAAAVPDLSRELVNDNMKIAKAADEALKQITHSVGKTLAGPEWRAVVSAFVKVVEGDFPAWSKAIAMRHLSLIGKEDVVEPVAKYLTDETLQEEAVYCLERIPGEPSARALLSGLAQVKREFKPRILAALGHRKDASAVSALVPLMASGDTLVAIPAMQALARIGAPLEDVQGLPDYEILTDREKQAFGDSYLRYYDAMAKRGDTESAIEVFQFIAENSPKEHFRSAAVVSLSKVGTAQAKEIIKGRLNDRAYIVQITAKKALEKMG